MIFHLTVINLTGKALLIAFWKSCGGKISNFGVNQH